MKSYAREIVFVTTLTTLLFRASFGFSAEPALPVPEKNPEAAEAEPIKESTESLFSFDLYADIYSAYVRRGMVLTEEPVWQPNAFLTLKLGEYGELSAGLFANFNTTTRRQHNQCGGIDELEYTLAYEVDVSFLTLGLAHTWYTYPGITDSSYEGSSRELKLSAEADNDYVVPFVEVNIDYAKADGIYALAGLRKELRVMDQLMVGAEITVGGGTNPYTDYYFGAHSTSGLVDGNIALYSQFDITDNIYIGARLAYMVLLDPALQDVYPEYDKDPPNQMIWGGLTFGVTF